MLRYIEKNNKKIAIISDCKISNTDDALDVMGTIYCENCDRIIIPKNVLDERFFELRTKLAGEILQKFTNYGIRLAIVGDFDDVKSKSLADFIYECNKGNTVFFKNSEQEALQVLVKA